MATYDPARLHVLLMNTGLQQKDQPLYQVIHDLISTLVGVNTTVNNVVSGVIIPGNGIGTTGKQGIQGIQGLQGESGDDSDSLIFIPTQSSFSSSIVDDNATNAAMYPVWVSTTPGNEQLKTSSTELIWNPSVPTLGIGGSGIDLLSIRTTDLTGAGITVYGALSGIQFHNAANSVAIGAILAATTRLDIVGGSGGLTLQRIGGLMGVGGVTIPTAFLHLTAGKITAAHAPLKFTSGPLLTTAEVGAIEFLTDAYYGTITTGATRKTFAFLQSPAFTGVISEENNGLSGISTDGIVLQNTTLTTALVPVQQSPRLRFRSHVWNTTAVAADNTNDWWIESTPVSTATPVGVLNFFSSLNGGGTTNPISFTSAGNLKILQDFNGGNTFISGSVFAAATSGFLFGSFGGFSGANADGKVNLRTNFATTGVGLDGSTDALLKIRTRAQTGDASLSSLNLTTSGTLIDKSYNIATPATLATVVMSANQQRQIINPAGTIAVLTVTLPSSPVDGQIAGISFTQIVSALTINAPGGATVVGPPASAAVNSEFRFLYQASSTSWFPAA